MALIGSSKRILVVGGEGVTLFGPTLRGIERVAALSWEVPNFGQQLIEALNEKHRGDPVLMLFDGADQTYRKEENIPKLSVFDRASYISNKLERAFPSYPVRASMLVEPKGEQPFYLFVALPETDRIDNIAADMLDAGVPIAGFGLLPAESVGLVTALSTELFAGNGKPSRWAVLISQHETGGLRQVVVRDGNLALTRITPTSEAGVHGPGWADEVMREFKGTLTYIARFGYAAEEGLDVIVVCSNIEKQFFTDKSMPVTNFQCLTPAEALSAIGSKGASLGETNFGDALHAAWVTKKRSLALPVMVPSIHRIMVPRMVASRASAILGLAMVGLGLFVFSQYKDYISIKSDMADHQQQAELLKQEYAQDSKAFDAYPVKPQMIKNVLAVNKLVDNSTVNITPTLNVLRAALDNDIKLKGLSFKHDATDIFAAGSATPGKKPSLFSKGPSAAEKSRGLVTIKFQFTLLGSLDLEHKVQRAEAVKATLEQRFPGYTVRILSQFGNVNSAGIFEGEAGKASTAAKQEDSAELEMVGPPL